jgi:hypothetical protein
MNYVQIGSITVLFSLSLLFSNCSDPSPEPPANVIAGDTTQAFIKFVDFEPDTVIPFIDRFDTAFFNLDINDDNISDIQIMTYQDWGGNYSRRWSKIKCLNDSVLIALCDTVDFPLVLNKLDVISDTLRWSNGEFLLFYKYGAEGGVSEQSGIWFNTDRNYIGIKYERYGWVCLDYKYPDVKVYDYAY